MKTHLNCKKTPANFAKTGILPGFTLVEILVVIVIAIILAAATFTVTQRARESAQGATCTSNLRQIGVAIISYATDRNGQLPPLEDRTNPGDGLKGIWPQVVADGGYLARVSNSKGRLSTGAGVWACPGCTVVQTNYQGYGAAEGTVMKVQRGTQPGSGSLRLSAIPRPERTWLVGDTANNANDLKSGWYAIWANPSKWTSAHVPAARHEGKINVCMVDGHVESLSVSELRSKDYTMFK